MYIVGTARSGSTAFTIHKALEAGIPFKGEINYSPAVVGTNTTRPNWKRDFHETGIQPTYTMAEFLAAWANLSDPNSMYLVNALNCDVGAWGGATAYITRKNIRNSLRSHANHVIKNYYGSTPTVRPFHFVRPLIERNLISTCLLLKFCADNNKTITWYEDVFEKETTYTAYNEWPHKVELEAFIDGLITEFRPELLNQNIVV
jgi:hypothetical protein